MLKRLLKARYVDDGMYCVGWWIEEEDGRRYADAFSEADAKEICDAVNAVRKLAKRVYDIAQREGVGDGSRLCAECDHPESDHFGCAVGSFCKRCPTDKHVWEHSFQPKETHES